MSLTDALDTLSKAHGPAELARAFHSLQSAVRRQRKAVQARAGSLAETVLEAMRIWDMQTADGVPRAERLAGMEKTLRVVWPFTREWKYVCNTCDDLGLMFAECPGNDHCGRSFPHGPHTYGAPCFCPKGAIFRAQPRPEPADFKAAGRSKPMTRIGR